MNVAEVVEARHIRDREVHLERVGRPVVLRVEEERLVGVKTEAALVVSDGDVVDVVLQCGTCATRVVVVVGA